MLRPQFLTHNIWLFKVGGCYVSSSSTRTSGSSKWVGVTSTVPQPHLARAIGWVVCLQFLNHNMWLFKVGGCYVSSSSTRTSGSSKWVGVTSTVSQPHLARAIGWVLVWTSSGTVRSSSPRTSGSSKWVGVMSTGHKIRLPVPHPEHLALPSGWVSCLQFLIQNLGLKRQTETVNGTSVS